MTESQLARSSVQRRWQVAAAATGLLVAALATVEAVARSTLTFALPGGSGSTTFAPGLFASVVDVLCVGALLALLVAAARGGVRWRSFSALLLTPLAIAIAVTAYALLAETPSF